MDHQLDKEWVYLPESEDSAFRKVMLRYLAWAVLLGEDSTEFERLADLFDKTLARRVLRVLFWIKRTLGVCGTLIAVLLAVVFAIAFGVLLLMSIPILRLCWRNTKGVMGFWEEVKETHSRLLPKEARDRIGLAVCAIYVSLARGRKVQGRGRSAKEGPLPGLTAVKASRRDSQRATAPRG